MSPTREAVIEAMARAMAAYAQATPAHDRVSYIGYATAALTAYESLTGSQEGFVLVPREALALLSALLSALEQGQ